MLLLEEVLLEEVLEEVSVLTQTNPRNNHHSSCVVITVKDFVCDAHSLISLFWSFSSPCIIKTRVLFCLLLPVYAAYFRVLMICVFLYVPSSEASVDTDHESCAGQIRPAGVKGHGRISKYFLMMENT